MRTGQKEHSYWPADMSAFDEVGLAWSFPREKSFVFSLWGLAVSVLLENIAVADRFVQRLFYNQGEWLITTAGHAQLKNLWYTGPKVVLGVLAALALMAAIGGIWSASLRKLAGEYRSSLLLFGLSIALIPLAVAGAKAVTGVYSPVDVIPYGGEYPHMGMLAHLWYYGGFGTGRSFPAGHASGGFALMVLYFFPVRKNIRCAGLVLGLLAGWGMGIYQMARGEHFFSHTLTSMFMAWCGIVLLHRWLQSENCVLKKIGF